MDSTYTAYNKVLSTLFTGFALCLIPIERAKSSEFEQQAEFELRLDDNSNQSAEFEYRVRYNPKIRFNDTWSLNSFIVTGNEYGSSHNTLDDGESDYLYMRRLYLRHQGDYGKTELGVIPTYKGRVSSSGLSKDGWIKGVRHVRKLGNDNLEIVLGELSTLDASKALQTPETLNYIEIEYSARIDQQWSYEISAERMTGGNFVRTEMRYKTSELTTLFAEFIARLYETKYKTVWGLESEFALANYPIEYFVHYAFVDDDFGLRAELTEDFLGTGHGIAGELGGSINDSGLAWFAGFEAVENNSRFQIGINWEL
ncbi:hypothetical protein [Glaciecola sp. 1036]|uniref:hypothetical protein n=1 Tax=Alteromonadaceae TaxID=72275 RepID=UPI003D0590E5